MLTWRMVIAVGLVVGLSSAQGVGAVTLDFESAIDLEPIGDLYSADGVHFANAIAATAGVSLNEIDFPPTSGVVVGVDADGPMILTFDFAAGSFAGNFSYSTTLTFTAYSDVARTSELGTFSTEQSSNLGSTELIVLSFEGARALQIAGDAAGFSFTVDDFQFEEVVGEVDPIPEPSSLLLLGAGGLIVLGCVLKHTPA